MQSETMSTAVSEEKHDYDNEKNPDSDSTEGSHMYGGKQLCRPVQQYHVRNCERTTAWIVLLYLVVVVHVGLGFLSYAYWHSSNGHTNGTNMTTTSFSNDIDGINLDNKSCIDLQLQLDVLITTQRELQNQLGLLTIQVNALQIQTQANVSRLDNKLSDTSEQFANISEQFQSLQSSLAPYQEVDDHLSSFNSSLSNLSVQFTTFATNFDSQLSSLNSSHKSQASELQSLQSDLSTLTFRVSDIPQEISNSFEQRFSDVDIRIISIEFTANRALRKADANEDKLDNLEDRVNGATRIIPYNSYSFLVSLCFVLILLLLSD